MTAIPKIVMKYWEKSFWHWQYCRVYIFALLSTAIFSYILNLAILASLNFVLGLGIIKFLGSQLLDTMSLRLATISFVRYSSQRNLTLSAVALQQKASDPIQQLFVEKVREYATKKKASGGKLVSSGSVFSCP